MEFLSTLNYEFLKDCLLIGLCALCALYCLLLSRRLKALSDMKSGLGASIVSLTEAIETTHQASQASRRDINASILEMQNLINQADSKANALEARLTEIKRNVRTANEVASVLNKVIEVKTPQALSQIISISDKFMADNKAKLSLNTNEIESDAA
jgi:hypothetical protein